MDALTRATRFRLSFVQVSYIGNHTHHDDDDDDDDHHHVKLDVIQPSVHVGGASQYPEHIPCGKPLLLWPDLFLTETLAAGDSSGEYLSISGEKLMPAYGVGVRRIGRRKYDHSLREVHSTVGLNSP